jgi:D-alanyl-D-alanine carboxypeptidase
MSASPRLSILSAAIAVALLASACSADAGRAAASPAPAQPVTAGPVPANTLPRPSASTKAGAYALGRFPGTPTASFSDPTIAALQAVLDKAVHEGLPGVTASILAGGRGAWTGAAGTSDGVQPMEVASQFGIASITKTVIAAEIVWLAEQRLLKLDDPVSAHLPATLEFDTNGATIRQLLSMTSGLQEPALTDAALIADPLRKWTPEELLASVPDHPSPPGTSFQYSWTNYILLGLVIEEVTGTSVAKALRAHLLVGPGLSSLVYQTEERPRGPLALPFIGRAVRPNILELGGGYLATRADASALGAAGGMASDAAALARFAYLLWGGQLLSEASLRAMTDFGDGDGYPYGLGTIDMTNQVLGRPFPVQTIGNGGQDSAGYASVMITLPSEATVVIVLINQDVDPRLRALPVAQELYEALATSDARPPAVASPTPSLSPSP